MRALKKTRKLLEQHPEKPAARVLAGLVLALESEEPFQLSSIYQLDYEDFDLAIQLLHEWRLDRYYSSKAMLLDVSLHLSQWQTEAATPPATPPVPPVTSA